MLFTADTVVVITGSSRGLGLEYVKQILSTTESTVVATARNLAKADALHGLANKHAKRIQLVALDVSDESSIKVTRHTCQRCERYVIKQFAGFYRLLWTRYLTLTLEWIY